MKPLLLGRMYAPSAAFATILLALGSADASAGGNGKYKISGTENYYGGKYGFHGTVTVKNRQSGVFRIEYNDGDRADGSYKLNFDTPLRETRKNRPSPAHGRNPASTEPRRSASRGPMAAIRLTSPTKRLVPVSVAPAAAANKCGQRVAAAPMPAGARLTSPAPPPSAVGIFHPDSKP